MSHPIDIQNAIALLHGEGYEIKAPPKPERIEVMIFNDGMAGSSLSIRPKNGSYGVPKEKNKAIKQAIESILNNEQPKEETNLPTFSYKDIPLSGELITKEECERREREAFWEARRIKDGTNGYGHIYPTYEDYQQSLKG